MHGYSWIALQIMMADAGWYDYDKAEESAEGSADNDGIVWIRTKDDLEKHKKDMQHAKEA